MSLLETERLTLHEFVPEDAEFILQLVNEPAWLQFIGDKGVRTLDDARAYLANGPIDMYRRLGHGLYRVALKDSGESIGMCGILKRDSLDTVDIGYALLPKFWGQGYAREAAAACLKHGLDVFAFRRVLAITKPDNAGSVRLLESLGFSYERSTPSANDGTVLSVYAYDAPAAARSGAPEATVNRSMPVASVIPELAYADVRQAAEWLCRAFGFSERLRIGDHRAQLVFGTGALVVVQRRPGDAARGSTMVRVANADAHCEQARQAGARILGEPVDQPYGERQYSAEDFDGHRWVFSQTIADVDPATWGGTVV